MWCLVSLVIFTVHCSNCQNVSRVTSALQILHDQGKAGLMGYLKQLQEEINTNTNNNISINFEIMGKNLKDNITVPLVTDVKITTNNEATNKKETIKEVTTSLPNKNIVIEVPSTNEVDVTNVTRMAKISSRVNDINITQEKGTINNTLMTFVHVNIPNSVSNATVLVQVPISINIRDLTAELLKDIENSHKTTEKRIDSNIIADILQQIKAKELTKSNENRKVTKNYKNKPKKSYFIGDVNDFIYGSLESASEKNRAYGTDSDNYVNVEPKHGYFKNIANKGTKILYLKDFVRNSDADIAKAIRHKIKVSKLEENTPEPGRLVVNDSIRLKLVV